MLGYGNDDTGSRKSWRISRLVRRFGIAVSRTQLNEGGALLLVLLEKRLNRVCETAPC